LKGGKDEDTDLLSDFFELFQEDDEAMIDTLDDMLSLIKFLTAESSPLEWYAEFIIVRLLDYIFV
jgi:hypothetical protein